MRDNAPLTMPPADRAHPLSMPVARDSPLLSIAVFADRLTTKSPNAAKGCSDHLQRECDSVGTCGRWFNGRSNFDISKDEFVVLELEHLRPHKELFKVAESDREDVKISFENS